MQVDVPKTLAGLDDVLEADASGMLGKMLEMLERREGINVPLEEVEYFVAAIDQPTWMLKDLPQDQWVDSMLIYVRFKTSDAERNDCATRNAKTPFHRWIDGVSDRPGIGFAPLMNAPGSSAPTTSDEGPRGLRARGSTGLDGFHRIERVDGDFTMGQFLEEYEFGRKQLKTSEARLKEFMSQANLRETEQRELLLSIPGIGFVTAEIVLAELADIERFTSQKQVVAYAGLSPGQRESAGKCQELHLEKTGSKMLRWAMVEAAWRLVRHTTKWKRVYEQLKQRLRAKKAIVAVARRLLTVVITPSSRAENSYSYTHELTGAAC